MLGALLLAAQAAAAAPPDIQLHATVDVRSVKVESRGRAEIRVWGEPDGGSVAQSSGTRQSRRFELRLDARIAQLLQPGTAQETDAPQPR